MAVRQEQIVFGVAALICGGLILTTNDAPKRASVRTKHREYVPSVVPEAVRSLPLGADSISATVPISRDLFREPTNARAMPKLAFIAPPVASLPGLSPAPSPGPRAASWGVFLRQATDVEEVTGLFDDLGAQEEFGTGAITAEGASSLDTLRDLGLVPGEDAPLVEEPNRAALLASYKELYDWILLDEFDYHFGSIDNPGLYRLVERETEDVGFTEVSPTTGLARYAAMGSVSFPRKRVTSFGFANNAVNRVELGAIEREGPITRGNMFERLAFADKCVAGRHDAPRGLDVARDLYSRIAAFEPGEPAPRLGLASCLEAGFKFEAAFAEYETLTTAFPSKASVAVAFANLEQRFLLVDQAETRLRQATRLETGSYLGHWALGQLLLNNADSADDAEALVAMEMAQRLVPDTTAAAPLRAKVRVDVGRAALVNGNLAAARSSFENALKAEALNQGAYAGLFNVAALERHAGLATLAPDLPENMGSLSAQILLARGLWLLEEREWQAAKMDLEAAVLSAPLSPSAALCGLSRLAELTGHGEESMEYAEAALTALPGHPWALYQRGRLLYMSDDLVGSAASLNAALAAEIDFVDAAVLLGQIAMDEERFGDAERYFDRARRLEAPRLPVEIRRGLNALFAHDIQAASERFEAASAIGDEGRLHPVVLAGTAWCNYERDRSDEAINLLAALDDSRRLDGDEDPWRVWARDQKARLEDHVQKERWIDEFDRKSLRNDWLIEEGAGPLVSLQEEAASITGQFRENGEVRVYRRLSAVRFVSLEADLTIGRETASRAGIFVARENRGSRRSISASVNVSRHKDGSLQTHVIRSGRPDLGAQDVSWLGFPTDRAVRLRIERAGESKNAVVNVYVDGTPVLQNVPMSSFGRTQSDLSIGFFVEGESGRKIELKLDNVEIVRRKS